MFPEKGIVRIAAFQVAEKTICILCPPSEASRFYVHSMYPCGNSNFSETEDHLPRSVWQFEKMLSRISNILLLIIDQVIGIRYGTTNEQNLMCYV